MPFNITSPAGPSGQSFNLKGNYATLQLFNAGAGASAGTPGDCWLIQSDGSLMVYSTTEGWIDAGDIIGPQGIQGAAGVKGDTGNTGSSGTSGLESSTRYSPTLTATGLTFTGSGVTYPTYNSYYVQAGKLVSFYIECSFATMTNRGTGQIKVELPLMPFNGSMNHFAAWIWYDSGNPVDTDPGHVVLQADHLPNTKVLDMHWYGAATANPKPVNEQLFTGVSPYNLTTNSKLFINGTYISA